METPSSPLIEIRGVTKTYTSGDVAVPVLKGIDLHLSRGQFMVIVGPSGSGKSTLLNIVGGLDSPTEGTVLFDGDDLSTLSDKQLTQYRKEKIGFVFQFYNLIPTLTAKENVEVATELVSDPMPAEDALRMVGLEDRAHHFPSQMSGGEQQRVSIARAVAKKPQLLLCDEPTGALDLTTGRNILKVLSNLDRDLDITVMLITHNSAIAAMADSTIRLGEGTVAEFVANDHPTDPEEIHW